VTRPATRPTTVSAAQPGYSPSRTPRQLRNAGLTARPISGGRRSRSPRQMIVVRTLPAAFGAGLVVVSSKRHRHGGRSSRVREPPDHCRELDGRPALLGPGAMHPGRPATGRDSRLPGGPAPAGAAGRLAGHVPAGPRPPVVAVHERAPGVHRLRGCLGHDHDRFRRSAEPGGKSDRCPGGIHLAQDPWPCRSGTCARSTGPTTAGRPLSRC